MSFLNRKLWIVVGGMALIISSIFFFQNTENLRKNPFIQGLFQSYQKDEGVPEDIYAQYKESIVTKRQKLSEFLELNKPNFSPHYYETLQELRKYILYGPAGSFKNLQKEEAGTMTMYRSSSDSKDLSQTKVILWIPPYHFPFNYIGTSMDKFPVSQDFSIIAIDLNVTQLTARNYDEYYHEIEKNIDLYFAKYHIRNVDLFLTSMSGPIGLRWMNDHPERVDNLYLHEVPAVERKNTAVDFWSENGPKEGVTKKFIKKISVPNDQIPTEFFSIANVNNYFPILEKNPGISPKDTAKALFSRNGYILALFKPTYSINFLLFKEIISEMSGKILTYKNIHLIQEKTRCIIAYKDDKIAPLEKMLPLKNPNTKIILQEGEHLDFMGKKSFTTDFFSCVKSSEK